jgi:MFS family permease
MGIEYVLVMSAVVSLANLIGTLLFFQEPEGGAQAPARTLGKVFADMVVVFGNFKFISFLVVFSGFWIMFWQIFYSLPFYVRDVLGYSRFELIEAVDAWAIIFLTVPVTALMKRVRPLSAMILGFAVASASWLLIASLPVLWVVVGAIALFAVGESLQAPRFYEYVADLAPAEQVGTFMGFAFLPVALGSLAAGPLSGWLVEHYLKAGRPAGMWVVVSIIGFASTLMMIAHDRLFRQRSAA